MLFFLPRSIYPGFIHLTESQCESNVSYCKNITPARAETLTIRSGVLQLLGNQAYHSNEFLNACYKSHSRSSNCTYILPICLQPTTIVVRGISVLAYLWLSHEAIKFQSSLQTNRPTIYLENNLIETFLVTFFSEMKYPRHLAMTAILLNSYLTLLVKWDVAFTVLKHSI